MQRRQLLQEAIELDDALARVMVHLLKLKAG